MGFRYRRSTKIGPFRINFSKRGVGWSVGTKGYRYTKKAGGGTRHTFKTPIKGLTYVTETSSKSSKKNHTVSNQRSSVPSNKNQTIAFFLCFFGGYFGLHQFYSGRVGMGILYLFTAGFCGVMWIVDICRILAGSFYDSYGCPIVNNAVFQNIGRLFTWIVGCVGSLINNIRNKKPEKSVDTSSAIVMPTNVNTQDVDNSAHLTDVDKKVVLDEESATGFSVNTAIKNSILTRQWPVKPNSIFDKFANWIDQKFFGSDYHLTTEKTMIVALCTNVTGLYRLYAGRKISAIIGWILLLFSFITRDYLLMFVIPWMLIDLVRIFFGNYGRLKTNSRFSFKKFSAMISYKLRLKYKIIFGSVSVALAAFILIAIPSSSYYNSINTNAKNNVTTVSNSDHNIISNSDTTTLPVATKNDNTTNDTTQSTTQSTTKTTESDVVELNAIQKFVNIYNQNAKEKITDLKTIDIHDEDGGHYRTEFRLSAFKNADAMTGIIGKNSVDIIICHNYLSEDIRFYLTTDSLDDAVAFSDITMQIFDNTLTKENIQTVNENLADERSSFVNHITYFFSRGQKTLFIECTSVDFDKVYEESASTKITQAAFTPPDEVSSEETSSEVEKKKYKIVLNKKTKVYHLNCNCSSALKIKKKNKKVVTSTIEDVEAKGYRACKRCS